MLRRIASSSAVYIAASLVAGGINFALLPVLTRYLTPADYGVLTVISATIGILGAVVGFNPSPFFTAKYPDLDRSNLRRYTTGVFLLVGAMVVLAYGALEGVWALGWGERALPSWALAGLAVMGGTVAVRKVGLAVFKMERQPLRYAALKVSEMAAGAGGAVLLVVAMGLDWRGKFLAQVAAGVGAAAVVIWYLTRVEFTGAWPRWEQVRRYARFSLPVIPHTLAFWAINAQDRYFLVGMVGLEEAGLYGVGYALAKVLDMVNTGVLNAFNPHFYEGMSDGSERRSIVRMTYLYLGLVPVVYVAFVLAMRYAAPLLVGSDFTGSGRFIPWVAAGYAFNALRNFMTGYLYVAERTRLLALLTISAALINAALNFALIDLLGAIGAAVATAVTFALLAGATAWLAVRDYEMPWRSVAAELLEGRWGR